jgi:hypothetical protein
MLKVLGASEPPKLAEGVRFLHDLLMNSTKTCSRCREDKPETDFNKRSVNKLSSECKECHRKLVKENYEKNKEYYLQKAKRRRKELREWYKSIKSELKCNRCEENHWSCLEFHHEDPKEKEINIPLAVWKGWSKKRILEEIKKCEVLCANCHRKHHHP